MKNIPYWIPLFGIVFIIKDTKGFKYSPEQFVGWGWKWWQLFCLVVLILT
jgi:hypothetical protein